MTNAYLDTSVVVSMFTSDAHTPRSMRWIAANAARATLGDWTLAEFSSVVATANRRGDLTGGQRNAAERAVDAWVIGRPILGAVFNDVEAARKLVQTSGHGLRAPAALHLSVVIRNGLSLATFDDRMAAAATDLGILVEAI